MIEALGASVACDGQLVAEYLRPHEIKTAPACLRDMSPDPLGELHHPLPCQEIGYCLLDAMDSD